MFGLYVFRIEGVKFIFNAVLDEHQIRVVNLQGLKMDSKSISIDAMDLVWGNNRAKQRFEGLTLDYSTAFPPIKRLHIRAASLSIPEFAATEKSPKPLMLSNLLSQLTEPPLPGDFVRVRVKCQIAGNTPGPYIFFQIVERRKIQ